MTPRQTMHRSRIKIQGTEGYRASQAAMLRPLQLADARDFLAVAMEPLTPMQQMAVLAHSHGFVDGELAAAHGVTRNAIYEARKHGMERMRRTLRVLGIERMEDILEAA